MFAPVVRFASLPYIYRVRHDPRRRIEGLAEPVAIHLDAVSSGSVGSENGLRNVRHRPDLLADALEELAKSPALRRDLGSAGRARAHELFDLRKNVATLREQFREEYASRLS